MSNTLAKPRSIAAILAVCGLVTLGVLLLAGAFSNDVSTPASDTGTAIVVVKTSGGIAEAQEQMQERQLQHGLAVPTTAQTGGADGTRARTYGDSKDDLSSSGGADNYEAGSTSGAGQ